MEITQRILSRTTLLPIVLVFGCHFAAHGASKCAKALSDPGIIGAISLISETLQIKHKNESIFAGNKLNQVLKSDSLFNSFEGSVSDKTFKWLLSEKNIFNSSKLPKDIDAFINLLQGAYIIKPGNIPQSYFDAQVEAQRLRGLTIKLNEANKTEITKLAIKDQKDSLHEWVNYFLSSDTNFYPTWFKQWSLHEMAKLGTFNKAQGYFNGRNESTVAPFPELNREALALTFDVLTRSINKQALPEKISEDLKASLKKKKFPQIYASALIASLPDINVLNTTQGHWIKFNKGSDSTLLSGSLKGHGTGWCTVGDSVAKEQLDSGDFYVYYSIDKNGDYKIPRLAIRMEDSQIGEVRGIAEKQNLDKKIAKTTILEEKLGEFGAEGIRYKKKTADMNKLSAIEEKNNSLKELTEDELRFLYEIDQKIEGFGYKSDPRIEDIKKQRDIKNDYAAIYNILPSEVSGNISDVLSGKCKVFIGHLMLKPEDNLLSINVIHVTGNLYADILVKSKGLESLQRIDGSAGFMSLKTAKGLKNLQWVGHSAEFRSLKTAKGLESLEYIGGSASFQLLTNAKAFKNLKYVGGHAYFHSLKPNAILKKATYRSMSYFKTLP